MKKLFSSMTNLQTHYHFKLDFQKVDQHREGKLLIHRTKHHKGNQLCSLELIRRISPSWESKHVIKECEGNMFNPIFKGSVKGRKQRVRCAFAEPELLSYRKPEHVFLNKL